jgi:Tfp pilus assembly protein PilV
MKVKQKDLLWSSLPSAKQKKKIMANLGMTMEPGPKNAGFKNLIKTLPPDYFDILSPTKVQGPVDMTPAADINKIPLGVPSTANVPKPTFPEMRRDRFNPGNALLLGMSAFDALLPDETIKQQVVQPQMSYNPYPYGTGSQALMDNGGYIMGEDEGNVPGARSGIYIKPSKRGTLHDALGISRDKKIPVSMLQDKPGDSPALKKKKLFARNARKWSHKEGGIIPDPMSNFNPHEYQDGGKVKGKKTAAKQTPEEKIASLLYHYPTPNDRLSPFYGTSSALNMSDSASYVAGYRSPMTPQQMYPMGFTLDSPLRAGYADKMRDSGKPIPEFFPTIKKNEHGGNVKMVGAKYPNTDLLEQIIQYCEAGGVMGPPLLEKLIKYEQGGYHEVGANYPNTDLLEQYIQYEQGGSLSPSKAKEMLRDGTANGKKLTKKQKRYFGMVAAGKAAEGDMVEPEPSAQERYYQASARLSHYKGLLNEQLKKKNPQAYQDYFKGLVDLRKKGNISEADKYIQNASWNDYLTPQEVRSSLGDEEYEQYINSIRDVNSYDVQQGRKPLYGTIEGESDLSNLNYGRRFASMQITPSYSAYNETRGTKYNRNYTYDPKTRQVNYTEQGDVNLRPSYLSSPIENSTAKMRKGGVVYDDGGAIDTMWGGDVELASYNPYDGGMAEFKGASHENGGIGMTYNNSPVEVEGGEFASKDKQGNLNIYGNMYLPGTRTKFKKVAKEIAQKEGRYDFLKSRGAELVNTASPHSRFEQLAFNSGKIMMEGGEMGQKDLADKKEKLSSLQRAMLDTADEFGIDPQEMSKGKVKKAKRGASIPSYANGGTDPNDPTRADRNNNPGNIKYGEFAKKYGAKRDKDGFAIFPSREVGMTAMQSLLTSPAYKDLSVRDAIKKWTGGEPYNYNLGQISGRKVSELSADQFGSVIDTMVKGEGTRYGGSGKRPPTPVTPPPNVPRYGLPPTTLTPDAPPRTPRTVVPPYDRLNPPPDEVPLPSNVEPLHINQVLGEIFAAATNKVEPVPTQRYDPQMFTPYQVSFQDRINRNQNAFSAAQRSIGATNPSALGAIAAQLYEANNQVAGDEFRTNQAISNDITNRNINLLNDAELKNLAIADTQMVRQSTARSKTRQLNQMIVNSLAGKYAQNEYENKRLAAYENLYDYRFVPQEDGGLYTQYYGPDAIFNYDGVDAVDQNKDVRTTSRYDAQGNLKGYSEEEDDELRKAKRRIDIESKRRKLPLLSAPRLQ